MKKRAVLILGGTLVLALIGAVSLFFIPNSACKKAQERISIGNKSLKNGEERYALIQYYTARKECGLLYLDPRLYPSISKGEEARKQRAQVIAFLKGEASTEQEESLKNEIEKVKGVREVKIISQEEALKRYKERNKDYPVLTKFVTENIFPATIEVYFDDFSIKHKVAELAKKKTFVQVVTEDTVLEDYTK
ncbi:MAG: permease-like cell division protein FtsX [bacterium]|nr:permease-like cell division protein FtsX [bacterium]